MKFNLYFPALVLTAAMVFFAYDILTDLMTGQDSILHIIIEFLVFVAISIVLTKELLHVRQLNRIIQTEKSKNIRLAGELLGVMYEQFKSWKLSSSEMEIALLLIKGLSMKEIAEARGVKEKTIRTQAASIYAKSGHAGRHELAAYFIEDLIGTVQTTQITQ